MENKEGKINFKFVISGLAFSIILLWMVSAVNIVLQSPGNFTFNATSNREINFTFTPIWSGNDENATTNCSLWLNSTSDGVSFRWEPVKNSSNSSIINNSLSWMNYTFSADGNYTWAIGCWNETNTSRGDGESGVELNFSSGNWTLVVDATAPIINTTFNVSTPQVRDVINFTANITDQFGLLFANWSVNLSTGTILMNYSISGTSADISNFTTLAGREDILNFTLYVTDALNNIGQNSTLITVADTIAPTFDFTTDSDMVGNLSNQTSYTLPVINISVLDTYGMGINLTENGTINISLETGGEWVINWSYNTLPDSNISCIGNADPATQADCSIDASTISTYVNFSNGTYTIKVDASDDSNASNVAFANITFTIDNVPPVLMYFNITNTSVFDVSGDSSAMQLGELNGTFINTTGHAAAQGMIIYLTANWTDNLTRPVEADFQFYNITLGDWQTINTTMDSNTGNISPSATNSEGWSNLSFTLPTGHNEFEGKNISFRVIANDSLGNVNTSVRNITMNVNDTTVPTITINGTLSVNNSNFTTTSVSVVSWAVIEPNAMAEINVSIDGAVNNVDGCDKFVRYTDAAGPNNANSYRNYSFATSIDPACTLGNGAHFMEVQARDSWGNVEVYFHNFTVESGTTPSINLTGLGNGTSGSTDILNGSVITPYTGINFTALDGTTSTIKNLTFTSSCNSTVQDFAVGQTPTVQNLSFIWPFNYTGCKGTEANHTVDVTVYDFAGNTLTKHYQFQVDDVAPTLTVHNPTDGYSTTERLDLNVSAFDDMSRIDSIGFYLDGGLALLNHTVKNGSFLTDAQGQNTSDVYGDELNRTFNYTGTHTIVVSVNDTMGNQYNSSSITFTMVGPIRPNEINDSLTQYLVNLTLVPVNVTVRLKDSAGEYQDIGSANETDSDQTFEIQIDLNTTSSDFINVTLTDINGSAANWDKINFSVFINETLFEGQVEQNFTAELFHFVMFNSSLEEFLPDSNDYYGTVELPVNISGDTSTVQEIWYFPDATSLTGASDRTNVSICTSVFTRTTTTPCWNYTNSGRTLLYVPHFSGAGGGVNNSVPPTISVTKPATTQDTTGGFVPNITVSADTVSCTFKTLNVTASTSSASGNTSSEGTLANNICTWSEFRFKNGAYNITFNATDANGNVNQSNTTFTVSDTTSPNGATSITSSASTTGAIITITGVNESVNATVWYGTQNTTAARTSSAITTTFSTSPSVTITLSTITEAQPYYYNVTLCDYQGNCKGNATVYSFTQTATAAAAAAASSSSGSSGGGVAAGAASNVQSSKAQVWSSIAAGTSLTMTVNKAQIGITEVTISNVANELKNVELKASSLNDNPVSASAAGRVFQYLQINKKNMGDEDVTGITIKFRVTKTWLSENGLTQGDIALWRYKNNMWAMLTTTMASSDETYVYYEAETPGFSYFAIGNKVGGTSAFAIIDMIREFYEGTSSLTAFDIIDNIRSFYGG